MSAGQATDEPSIEASLTSARGRFLAFVRRRVSDPDLAEDILQDALLRAVRSAPDLRDEDRLIAWFYTVLRNAIIDAYRRRDVRQRRLAPLDAGIDLADEPSDESTRTLCECFRALLPTMKPEYAAVIEAVDLGAEAPEAVATRLGITRNNLNVRHHRARVALRERLSETCRICSDHGCLDCTCDAAPQTPV